MRILLLFSLCFPLFCTRLLAEWYEADYGSQSVIGLISSTEKEFQDIEYATCRENKRRLMPTLHITDEINSIALHSCSWQEFDAGEEESYSLWQMTQMAAAGLVEQISLAREYLFYVRSRLCLSEQMKEPIDWLAHEIFGNGFLQFCGYYHEEACTNCSAFGYEVSDRVRVTFINGMLNLQSDLETSIRTISDTHGGVKIHYVFRPTEGWTHDLFACFASKAGMVSIQAQLLADTWHALIEEMGGVEGQGRIIHYAHSIGATDTYVAKELLSIEEQAMIRVVTLGSPSLMMDDRGFGNVKHYVSKRDGVSMVVDPIGYLSGLLLEDVNISLIGTYWGIPFIDHTLFTESYFSIIEKLGGDFVKEFAQ
jgi:hypothetical protein